MRSILASRRGTLSQQPFSPFGISWASACWASDPLWAHPADSSPVSSWRNNSGGDPSNTGTARPTYHESVAGYNNRPAVQFQTASSQFLDSNTTDVNQPLTLVAIGNTAGPNGVAERLMGLNGLSTGMGDSSGGAWQIGAGSFVTGSTANSSPHLFSGYFNGASSTLRVDGTSVLSGNASTQGAVRFMIGTGSSGGTALLNGYVAFAAIYAGDFTLDARYDDFKRWVRDFYGLTVA